MLQDERLCSLQKSRATTKDSVAQTGSYFCLMKKSVWQFAGKLILIDFLQILLPQWCTYVLQALCEKYKDKRTLK